jgi:2,3-bisphosphoglycerate-independent phosphoglycerate mutase
MKRAVLIIMDGWGFREEKKHNAIAAANPPNFNLFWKTYPHARLHASGEAIGLPEGQIGTSEANHLVIGSGRILYQNLMRINRAIKNERIRENQAIKEAVDHVKKHNSILHITGILGPGGVHGHTEHIKAIIKVAKEAGVRDIMVHLFTDGRDVLPKSAIEYIRDIEEYIKKIGAGRITTIGGRYWGMDRDKNLDRTEKHFKVMVVGDGPRFKSPISVIEEAYKKGVTDEFIDPSLIETEEGEVGTIQTNDAVISTLFRADRGKQLTKRLLQEKISNLKLVTMTRYEEGLDVRVAFPPEKITNSLSEVLSQNNLKQLKITETEKFTHLTFFLNAQKDAPDKGEDRVMIPSDKVKTFDEKPAMKTKKIADKIVEELNNDKYDFITTNLVNADMVGHTGNVGATIKAVLTVDRAIGRIVEAAQKNNVDVIITADHGNAEETYDEIRHQPITAHTLNPVPFILISNRFKEINRQEGSLADIAPTVLKLLDIRKPVEMTGQSFV